MYCTWNTPRLLYGGNLAGVNMYEYLCNTFLYCTHLMLTRCYPFALILTYFISFLPQLFDSALCMLILVSRVLVLFMLMNSIMQSVVWKFPWSFCICPYNCIRCFCCIKWFALSCIALNGMIVYSYTYTYLYSLKHPSVSEKSVRLQIFIGGIECVR